MYGISQAVATAISGPNVRGVRDLQLNRLVSQEELRFHFSS